MFYKKNSQPNPDRLPDEEPKVREGLISGKVEAPKYLGSRTERVNRMHMNHIENIVPFALGALMLVYSKPNEIAGTKFF